MTDRRAGTRRRHPARRARIAATGIGATTMFGLVGVMGLAQRSTSDAAPVAVQQPQVAIVAPTPDAATTPGTGSATLTARPTVRPAPSTSQAPKASTSGSR